MSGARVARVLLCPPAGTPAAALAAAAHPGKVSRFGTNATHVGVSRSDIRIIPTFWSRPGTLPAPFVPNLDTHHHTHPGRQRSCVSGSTRATSPRARLLTPGETDQPGPSHYRTRPRRCPRLPHAPKPEEPVANASQRSTEGAIDMHQTGHWRSQLPMQLGCDPAPQP